jgi:hypothetical protein
MQGLGVFACRRDAWPGLNPRLSGFGGEEGYLRPGRRVRHRAFRDALGQGACPRHRRSRAARNGGSIFSFSTRSTASIWTARKDRWEDVTRRFEALGIAQQVRRFAAVETPSNHHIGCTLSHRAILAEAKAQGLQNVLVVEDDVLFSPEAPAELRRAVDELGRRSWPALYLGGHRWGRSFEKAPGCRYLEEPHGLTCLHAIAYLSQEERAFGLATQEKACRAIRHSAAIYAERSKSVHSLNPRAAIRLGGRRARRNRRTGASGSGAARGLPGGPQCGLDGDRCPLAAPVVDLARRSALRSDWNFGAAVLPVVLTLTASEQRAHAGQALSSTTPRPCIR